MENDNIQIEDGADMPTGAELDGEAQAMDTADVLLATSPREIEFNAGWEKADFNRADRIVNRAMELVTGLDRMTITMDLATLAPADLEALEGFDGFNFIHDIVGITNHLDRETGEFMNCFRPRCKRGN